MYCCIVFLWTVSFAMETLAFVPCRWQDFTTIPFATERSKTKCYGNWLGDLWEEVIEFSTYGPAERRMLKARREAAAARKEQGISTKAFQEAKRNVMETKVDIGDEDDTSLISLESFQAALVATKMEQENDGSIPDDGFDGYALRDLLVSRWNAPLDIDFQRGAKRTVYCTVLPVVGFGSRKSRHVSELDYLMHLQGIVEILHKYENLELFRVFLETTTRVPKPGTDSVPFRLQLNTQDLDQILGKV